MKKIAISIILLLSLSLIFAENKYDIFPSYSSANDVVNYFIENGWKISLNKAKTSLKCEPSEDYYYKNQKISTIDFTFTQYGTIQTQTITLGYPSRTLAEAYKVLLDIACQDLTTFINVKYIESDNSVTTIAYYTATPDYNACMHTLFGVDGQYLISILYGNSN